ncbi:FUSC family protein [Lutibacter flavus]|uniref:Uncharacterized membrane protein YccC n=1 Tax=Lutibacter flavus TaxID=691689 RepID=A0A238Z2L8_9FLAO|nr:FUSC family membrane protein [Lutibacter flavus]SNR77512.1 Uncharacterized membrane protein YccC [Lutibacter flavus]
MFESIKRFFKSFNFLKAVVLASAMIAPILISNVLFGKISFGFSIALGVLFCFPTDVPGGFKHKYLGIISAVFLSFCLTLIFGSIAHLIWLLLPLLGVFVFLVSYVSVFGFRASLIAFSGLLAIVLSFANDYNEIPLLTHAFLIALGGLWYISLSILTLLLFPKFQTDDLFIDTIEKTAEFLRLRGDLLVCKTNRDKLSIRMFELQTEINESHESIRGIILSKRLKSGFSNITRRQQLFFSELLDIYELAISNPINYEKFDEVFKQHKEKIEEFKNLSYEMALQLEHIAKVIRKEEPLKANSIIPEKLNEIQRNIDYYRILIGMPKARVGTLMLLNLKSYQEKQAQNIIGLERVLSNYNKNNTISSIKDAGRFITPQDYDLKKLIDNLSFKSPIFKHSLRLAIIVMLGFVIGRAFEMQNPYWILITIIVIMRPSFGLTKERSIHRVFGTLIGAGLATLVILITQNTILYGVLAIISLPLAFSLMQYNYRNAAIFITLNVVFVYALIEPNILSVIKFRIFDTLIGATLSFGANYLLWPSWQFQNISESFIDALKSNRIFLKQIDVYYHKKGEVPTSFKLARKEAFLNVGNLNAAYQRMNQDPKSKQKELSIIYKIVVLNNTFLSSLTSLGTFFRNNKTTEPSPHFKVYVEHIISNLNIAIQLLENNLIKEEVEHSDVKKAEDLFDSNFETLSKKRDAEIKQGIEISPELGSKLKEAQLVSEQVKWLFNLSEILVSSVKQYKI